MAQGQPVALSDPFKIDVSSCRSCGSAHFQLNCQPYKKENAPFTHFYICPADVQPVNLALMVSDNVRVELHHKVMQDVYKYQGRPVIFFTAVIEPDSATGVVVHAHRENGFPHERFSELIEQTQNILKKWLPPGESAEPLKAADPNQMKLFGSPGIAMADNKLVDATEQSAEASDPESDEEGGK